MDITITNDELLILKSILLGKGTDDIKKLLFIDKIKGSYPKLEENNFMILEENWNYVSDEIKSLYIFLSKQPNLTPLEIRVQKKNAKLGFPIKRERIIPKELLTKGIENVSKNQVENYNSKKHKNYPELSLNSPIKIYRYYDNNSICKILKIKLSEIKSICKKAKIDFNDNKKFTFDEWELISPQLDTIRTKLLNDQREEELNFNKSKINLIHEYIIKMNENIKQKYQESNRKDAVQRNSTVSNSFREISTGMKS